MPGSLVPFWAPTYKHSHAAALLATGCLINIGRAYCNIHGHTNFGLVFAEIDLNANVYGAHTGVASEFFETPPQRGVWLKYNEMIEHLGNTKNEKEV